VSTTTVSIAGNDTLYAQWSIENYCIVFTSNGGTAVFNVCADYGAAISQPSNPTKTGYTFEGWYSDSGLTTTFAWPGTMPDYGANNATKTVYAKCGIEDYTYNFIENGGSAVTNINENYGTSLTSYSTTTTRTGYTFDSWYENSNLTTAWTLPATMPDLGADGTVKNIYAG